MPILNRKLGDNLWTTSQAFEAAEAGKGPNMLFNFTVVLCVTISTSLNVSNKKAAPASSVPVSDSSPTEEMKNMSTETNKQLHHSGGCG